MAEPSRTPIEGTLYSVNGEGMVRMQGRLNSDCGGVWSALTDPQRLALWYGSVEGGLHVGGEFTAFVVASEWDGRGRIEVCDPLQKLEVRTWEVVGVEHVIAVELIEDGDQTVLELEIRQLPLDLVWAYGVGWHVHLEDLGAHLSGANTMNLPTRWDELEPLYRGKTVLAR